MKGVGRRCLLAFRVLLLTTSVVHSNCLQVSAVSDLRSGPALFNLVWGAHLVMPAVRHQLW
jgi:hypothetical protein